MLIGIGMLSILSISAMATNVTNYKKTQTQLKNVYSYLEYFLFKRKCDRDVHKKIIDYLKDDRKGLNFIK